MFSLTENSFKSCPTRPEPLMHTNISLTKLQNKAIQNQVLVILSLF
jgi:hypothetical protein